MGRLSALAAVCAVAALVAVFVARYEPARRATNRASAPADEPAPHDETPPPVPVRGLVRMDAEPAEGVEVVVYRIPGIQQWQFSAFGEVTGIVHAVESVPTDVLARVTSGADGRFACEVPRGPCAAVAARRQKLFEADEDGTELVFNLETRRDVRVTFVDPDGAPVEGARVLVYDRSSIQPPVAELTTDDAGAVAVGFARELIAYAPGLATTRVERGEEPREQRVEMAWGRGILGRVVDTAGEPIAGAAVLMCFVVRVGIDGLPPPWWRRVTGPDGRFAFEGAREGQHSLLVMKQGFTTEHAFIWPVEPDARFVLVRTGSVSGVVLFPDGTPAPEARIGSVRSAADGTFRLDGVAAGRRRVSATRNNGGSREYEASTEVDVPEGGHVEGVTLELRKIERSYIHYVAVGASGKRVESTRTFEEPPGTTVTVFVAGRSIRTKPGLLGTTLTTKTTASPDEVVTVRLPEPVDVTLVVRDEHGAPVEQFVEFDLHSDGWIVDKRAGRVELAANPERRLVFTVAVADFIRERFERPPPEGGTIEVVLRRGCWLTGRVVNADGEPRPGIVSLRAGEYTGVKTDPDGCFVMEGLRPGPATLFAGVVRELVLAPGRNDAGTIRLHAPVRVRGTVVDADGRPVWQAEVRLHDRGTGRQVFRGPGMRTRGDGSFDLSVEPCRDYTLRVDAEGYATTFAPIVPAPRVVLRPGGTIVVRVPEREIKNQWYVGVRDAHDKWKPRDTSRDRRREWTLTGVPPGRWEVFLWRYGNPAPDLARPCTVVAGETTVVRLD